MKKRIYKDRVLTQTEKNRRHQDKISSIDKQLNDALSKIDWKRRNNASKSLLNFINSYCVGIMLDTPPSGKMVDVIQQLEQCTQVVTPTCIQIPRGQGKTSISECLMLYVLCCHPDKHKFGIIVSQNARSAGNILKDCQRMILEPDTAFANDFPEVTLPFALGGNGRKRQIYNGLETNISNNSSQIVFPRLRKEDGSEFLTSNSVLMAKPITSCRGSKFSKLRPTICLIDDIQTAESASNPEQVQKQMDLINKDIFNLSGQGKKLNLIMTATPLNAEDLCEVIEHNINWRTIKYKAIIRYPDDMEQHPDDGLWHDYFVKYDSETINEKDHSESLQFYRDNFDAMNVGSEVFNDNYAEKDGHISAIQKFLEKRHMIGIASFQCEMQMQPIKSKFALEISPNKVSSKINKFEQFEIPDEYRYVTFGIDCNTSYAITVTGIAWKIDTTGIIFYHDIFPCQVDQKLPDTAYNNKVYQVLEDVCNKIKSLGIRPNAIAIDCGGRNWDAVTLFCKQYRELPVCAFAGRSSTQFANYQYSRTRLKDAIGRTVLCGSNEERSKSGSGTKYVFFDADYMKHSIQMGLNCVVGDIGSLSMYRATKEEHAEFIIQLCNERIKHIAHKSDGRDQYTWESKEPHDYLDTCAECRAALSQLGITSNTFKQNFQKNHKLKVTKKKPKIKIV